MSGGSLGYFFGELQQHIGDFDDKELDDLTKDLADLFYSREWFLSGDTCEGEWNQKRDAFKKKWFTSDGRIERVEEYLKEIERKVLDSFGFGKYCGSCKNWTRNDRVKKYGDCKLKNNCLWHECDSACEFFERVSK